MTPFSFNFGYDPSKPFSESHGVDGPNYTSKYLDYDHENIRAAGNDTTTLPGETEEVSVYDWYSKPTCSELAYIAASIPEECSLIEHIMGEEWLGCGSRDHWYYGSMHRSVPTARFKQHTNAELSFFRDVCGSDFQKDQTAHVPVRVVVVQLQIRTSESTSNIIEHSLDFGTRITGLRY